MSADAAFQIVNVLPVPIWAVWILAPGSGLARALARSLWPVGVLSAIYAVLVTMGIAGQGGFDPSAFGSLAAIMALFDSPWFALAGWVHYLAFDLFVGRWILLDAPGAGWRLSPILLFTFMFGPLGLLGYLLARPALHRLGEGR